MIRRARCLLLLTACLLAHVVKGKPLAVVASTADLAAVANAVGGSSVAVTVVCAAGQDAHEVELLPEHWVAVKEAVIYLKVGVGLDFWADALIESAGSKTLRVVDCSKGIDIIDGTTEHGDHVHVQGNPHYCLGPSSLRSIAYTICDGLSTVNPYGRSSYEKNRDRFVESLDSLISIWAARLSACESSPVITYHRTWDYFARDFGWNIVAAIEPAPGSEPGPGDIANLLAAAKTHGVKLCLVEPFQPAAIVDLVQRETGVKVVRLPASVQDPLADGASLRFFDQLIDRLVLACKESGK